MLQKYNSYICKVVQWCNRSHFQEPKELHFLIHQSSRLVAAVFKHPPIDQHWEAYMWGELEDRLDGQPTPKPCVLVQGVIIETTNPQTRRRYLYIGPDTWWIPLDLLR